MEESPFAKKNVKDPETQLYFEYREQCVEYLDNLLKHKMFHRAKKIPVDDKFLKSKKKKKENAADQETDDGNKSDAKQIAEKKKKRKIRLDMHLEQLFLDSKDAYVWIYDPTPWYYWVGGGAIVLITIAVCLFPLWPPWMRLGVHYLSIAAAGFLVFIIALGVIKYIIFALVFIFTTGKLKLWIFPNLTEDVGFFESFWPIYVYTYDKPKKAKDSDDEESSEEEEEDEDEKEEQEDGARDGDGEGSEGDKHEENSDDNSKSSEA